MREKPSPVAVRKGGRWSSVWSEGERGNDRQVDPPPPTSQDGDMAQRCGVRSNQKDLRGFPQDKIFFLLPRQISENTNLLRKAGEAAGMGPTRCCPDVIELGHVHVMVKCLSLRLGVRPACLLSPRLLDTVLGVPATAIRQENEEKACRSGRKNCNCPYLQMT